ncbi:MAG: hypothetical protein RJA81_338, partial [Planctomycetota bacterium]
EVAMQYLIRNNMLTVIDSNKNGAITAAEIQNFVDNASAMGLAEAGSMARLLGGISTFDAGATEYVTKTSSAVPLNDVPDPAGALARRFNYFDYAANGELKGYLTYDQIKMLSQTLLPSPTSFVITDRTRSSANAYLLDPQALRNYNEITKLNYSWVYASGRDLRKYRGFSPAQWGVNSGLNDRTDPAYVLFEGPPPVKAASATGGTSATTATASSSATSSSSNSANVASTQAQSTPTGTTNASTATPSAADQQQAAILAAIQSLISQNSVQPTGTMTPVITTTVDAADSSTTTASALQGAAAMNRKRPAVAASQQVSPLVIAQKARPAQSKSALASLADKFGFGGLF